MPDADRTPSLTRRILKTIGTVLSTSMTAAIAVGLVVIGTSFIAERAQSVGLPDAAPVITVKTQALSREAGYSVTRNFVGQVEAAQQADLAFEAGGTLAEIRVEEGAEVEKGAILALTDTRALQAERDATRAGRAALNAQLELAQLTTSRQEALEKRGFAATQRFDEARLAVRELQARLEQADAQLTRIDVALDKSVLSAPFAGRVGARMADLGQTVNAGQPVLRLLENNAVRMRVGLPAHLNLNTLDGHTATARFGEMNYTARLVHLRPDLDPMTRTRGALFELSSPDDQTLPAFGQSGSITFAQRVEDAGAWVPLMALREGANGSWTVLTVDADNQAALEAVELLHSDETRAFVRGSFEDGTALIAAGPHRVVPGQTVTVAE